MKNKKESFNRMLRLVTLNFSEVATRFLTLTFAENIKCVQTANKHFKEFVKRWRKEYGTDFRYIATIEFQDKFGRGAVHYHVITDGDYIKSKELERLWGNGFVKINKVEDGKHAAVYAGKYMRKGMLNERLQGKKSYWTSRNLLQPVQLDNGKAVYYLACIPENELEKYTEYTYPSEACGTIRYRKFFRKKTSGVPDGQMELFASEQ